MAIPGDGWTRIGYFLTLAPALTWLGLVAPFTMGWGATDELYGGFGTIVLAMVLGALGFTLAWVVSLLAPASKLFGVAAAAWIAAVVLTFWVGMFGVLA